MPNVYAACWTVSSAALTGVTTGGRIDTLRKMAFAVDTEFRIKGNVAGGGFHHLLVVPEYVFTSGGALLARDDKHAIYRQLIQVSAQAPKLILVAGSIAYGKGTGGSAHTYNVCPILYGGRIVSKLYKSDDDGIYQVNGSFRTKGDGGKAVPLVTINGLSIGVDICMDYSSDRLRKYLAANHLPNPDVHIQISGSNNRQAGRNAARVGGVYFHCDLSTKGAEGATAWRVTNQDPVLQAKTTVINPVKTVPESGGLLMYFEVAI